MTTIALAVALVASLGIGAIVFRHGGPDAGQSTPYWTAWNAWQDKARPVMTNLSSEMNAIASAYDAGRFVTPSDLVTLIVDSDHARALKKCPDTTLQVNLTSYVDAVTSFEARFIVSSKSKKKNPFTWVPADLTSVLSTGQSMFSIWDAEVRDYNSR